MIFIDDELKSNIFVKLLTLIVSRYIYIYKIYTSSYITYKIKIYIYLLLHTYR